MIADLPPPKTVLIQTTGGTEPYEAKAIGELVNNATANAVAGASPGHDFDSGSGGALIS